MLKRKRNALNQGAGRAVSNQERNGPTRETDRRGGVQISRKFSSGVFVRACECANKRLQYLQRQCILGLDLRLDWHATRHLDTACASFDWV